MTSRTLIALVLLLGASLLRAAEGASSPALLSWADCLAEAARYHPDLVVATESVTQAKAALTQAQGAQLPTISASAGVGRSKNSSQPATNSSSVGVSGSFTLFDGGAKRAAANEAKASLSARRAGYTVTSAQLRSDLRTAFIGLWQAQETITLSESILKLRQANLKLINLRYESGIEHHGALLTARANAARAQADLASARRNLRQAQVALCKAIGYPLSRALSVGALSVPAAPEAAPDFDALAKDHPSYVKALASERVAREALHVAQAANWPTVTLSADASRASNNIPPKENQASVSASVNYTFFNGFAREASIQQSRSAYRAALATTLSTYNTLFSALRSSYDAFLSALDTTSVQSAFLAANTEREKIAQAQYSVGLLTYDNWSIIEDNLVSSKQADLAARAAALKAEAAWELAKGLPLPNE